MTQRQLKVLKKKYLKEGYKMGLKEALNANFYDKSSSFNFDADDDGDSYTGNSKHPDNNNRQRNTNLRRKNDGDSTQYSVKDIENLIDKVHIKVCDERMGKWGKGYNLRLIEDKCPNFVKSLTNKINADGDLQKNDFNNIYCICVLTSGGFDSINEDLAGDYGYAYANNDGDDDLECIRRMFVNELAAKKTKYYNYYVLNVSWPDDYKSNKMYVFLEQSI